MSEKNCTNCGYGLWWSYGGGFTHLYEPSPCFESLSARCMWPLYNKKIAAKLPPMFSMAAFSYCLESPPEKDCPAWKPEKFPGSAPRWGEMWRDWSRRFDEMLLEKADRIRQESDERLRLQIAKNPEAWKADASCFRKLGHDSFADEIERLLPEPFRK